VIGVDTNVVLRLYDRTDTVQALAADRVVASARERGGCFINPIVLAELAWTLDRTYKLNRTSVAERIDRILNSAEFVVPFADATAAALEKYRSGSAGFTDYLLAEINRSFNCETTFTFDRAAAEGDGFSLLAS
jgi:predicted nucleic-acid-binding protein